MDSLQSAQYRPHPLLQPYVSSYLFTSVSADVPAILDLFPVGHSVLSFALQEIPKVFEWGRSVNTRFNITGQLTKNYKLPISGHYSYVYILFKPYGAYRLLRIPQYHLREQCIDLLDLGDHSLHVLYGQLLDQGPNPINVLCLLEEWLLKQLERYQPDNRFTMVIHASRKMADVNGIERIGSLYKSLGTSKSSLERQFQEKIGLSPKGYSSIARFLQALKTMRQGSFKTWTEVVYQHNYFDQTHFIKEFSRYTGYTPSHFFDSHFNMAEHFEEVKEK